MDSINIITTIISSAVIIFIFFYVYKFLTSSSSLDWLKNLFNINNPNSIPCGGNCYNEQICDLRLNKCRKYCKDGESFYDIGTEGVCCNNTTHEIIENVCQEKCPIGKTRCGNTDCLDPANETCVNGKICNNQYVANKETETGGITKKCCGKDDIGNQLFPLNGDCVACLGKKCGSNCCPTKDSSDAKDINHPGNKHAGTQCVAPDYCCDPKFVGKDDVTGIETCCQNELCGTKCCSGSKTCNKNAVGGPKCQVKCGDEFCPDDSDLCVNNNGKLKCYPSSCKWEQSNYVPPAIYDKTGGVQKLRSVCLAGGNTITSEKPMVTVSGINPVMSSDTSISLSATENKQRCKTVDACLGKIQQLGLEHAVYDDTLIIDNNICKGKVNCSNLLPTMEELKTKYNYTLDNKRPDGYYDKTLCPAKKEDGTDDVNCCYDRVTKEFNGYVCPDNQSCYNDILTEQQYCYKKGSTKPSSYNLNNCSDVVEPKIIKNTLTCDCPLGTHAGTKCQYNNYTNCNNNGNVIVDVKTDNFSSCQCNPGFTGTNCENIRILKVNEIQSYLGGITSSICNGCHIVAGPGISLTLWPVNSVSYYNSNLYVSTIYRGPVKVDYTATYKISGIEKTFSGTVTLENCIYDYYGYGYFPQVSGTNNFVVKSAEYLKSAAIAVIGIPIKVNVDGTKRYLDWDGNDCPASDVKTTNWFSCSDSNKEKCCKNNLTTSGYCDYHLNPCGDTRKSDNLAENTPALNKSIIESRGVGGYYLDQ